MHYSGEDQDSLVDVEAFLDPKAKLTGTSSPQSS